MDNPHQFNKSLAKGLAILEFIAANNGEATLTIIANRLGMDKATVKRFLNTLADLGYVTVSQHGKTFSTTLKALHIGYAAISHLAWRGIATSHLEQLFAEIRETISLSILQGTEIVYLLRLNKENFGVQDVGIGSRRPAFASAMGKMLLALEPPAQQRELMASIQFLQLTPHTVKTPEILLGQLEEARRSGYAVSDQETSELTRSIATPIMHGEHVVAAFAIALRVDDYTRESMIERMVPRAREYAARISAELQHIEYSPGPLG